MSTTLFIEAFGQLSGPAVIDAQEEDLHSVFRARAELMGWAATSDESPLLWSMEEAEITADTDPYRIGWVQVGLGVGPFEAFSIPTDPVPGWAGLPIRRRSGEPVTALAALVQCFSDALGRFGAVELSGLQVTASELETGTRSCRWYLVSALNWFNTDSKAGAEAIVAFDQDLLGCHDVSELVATLQHKDTYPFEFRTAVAVSERNAVNVPAETPFYPVAPKSDMGVFVTMPEWTPSAAGWVLASVVDAARLIEPDANSFMARVTRV